jgi:hypothetical protein
MEDAMKSEGEFLIEKELTSIKSRKLVAFPSFSALSSFCSLSPTLSLMTPTLHPIPLHYHLTPTPPVLFPSFFML